MLLETVLDNTAYITGHNTVAQCWYRVSGTLCLLHYDVLRDRDISLVQFKRLLKTLWFVWAAAHIDCCFFLRRVGLQYSYLLTYLHVQRSLCRCYG